MSILRYAGGTLYLAVLVAALAAGAVAVRRRTVPSWTGAVARLAEAVVALATVTVVAELLGTVGLLRRWPVLVATVAAGAVEVVLGRRRRGDGRAVAPHEPPPPPGAATALSFVAVAAVAGAWVTHTAVALRDGVSHYDSLWYHLSRAARFAQDGWVTRLHFTRSEFPDTFHPSGSELLHAVAMVAYDRDAVSPLLNLAWLAAALLAAWCVGRPFGAGPVSLAGVAVLLGSPLVVVEHGGTASNDVAATFFLLAAAALLLQPEGGRARDVLAGVAAGLAVAVKLTALVPVGVVTLVLVVRWARRREFGAAAWWCAALAGAGGFWYVVALAHTGSPLPGTDLGPLPSARFEIVERVGFSVADYLTDGSVWREWFRPGLRHDFGAAWPLVLVPAVAGAVVAAARGPARARVLAVASAAGAAAYLVLPTTALGERGAPVLFAANVVYAMPAMALAAALVVLGPWWRAVRAQVVVVGGLVALLAIEAAGGDVDPWAAGERARGVAAALVVLAALGAVLVWGRRVARPLLVAAAVVGAAAAGPVVVDSVEDRWRGDEVRRWGQETAGARIALAGHLVQHPLTGRTLDNDVRYVGVRGDHGAYHEHRSCRAWWRALRDGGYRYVVVGPEWYDPALEDERRAWLEAGGTRRVASAGEVTVDELDPGGPEPACAS